jgi:hypothetical protein
VAAAEGTGRRGDVGLNLREVCAVAYALLIEQLERQLAVQTQAALFAQAMGGKAEVPDPVAVRARFDELLRAEPVGVASSRTEVLREAFGLTGGG